MRIVFALAAAVAAILWFPLSRFDRSTIVLRNARGMPLRLVLFEPQSAIRSRKSAILVLQPVNSPPEAGLALILEFVRRGMVVAAIDFRGAAPGENRSMLRDNVLGVTALDAAAALNYLAARPDVDRERIGMIGHSVGGTLAIRAAMEQPWVRAAIPVGIAGDVTKELPQNVLWLVGLYDEFRPLSEMQEVMEKSNSEGVATIEDTAGDFARGTARQLSVVAADHFTEFLSHGAVVAAVGWFESAFAGRRVAPPRLAFAPLFYACYAVAFLSGWIVLYQLLRRCALRPRTLGAATALTIALMCLLPLPRLAIVRADVALVALLLLMAVDGGADFPNARNIGARRGPRSLRRFGRLAVLVWISFVCTLVVNQVAYFWRYPILLLSAIPFPLWHATGVLNSYLLIYPRAVLFANYTGAVLRPGWIFLRLLAAELVWPGWPARLGKRLRGPTQRKALAGCRPAPCAGLGASGPQRSSRTAFIALFVLLAALALVISIRATQGFVTHESLARGGWVILRFAVLPFFIFGLLTRALARRAKLKSDTLPL